MSKRDLGVITQVGEITARPFLVKYDKMVYIADSQKKAGHSFPAISKVMFMFVRFPHQLYTYTFMIKQPLKVVNW